FVEPMRRHGIDAAYLDYCKQLVWRATRTALAGPDELPCVAACDRALRELEFYFPIPERAHPTIDAFADDAFEIERGYIKGFIDLLIEVDGRVYFADWKSDILPDYADAALDAHVRERYAMQAVIYALAVVKFLDIHDEKTYEERFGGYLYLFIRGMGEGGRGVYFRRPDWDDVRAYETQLRDEVAY
ncbi:MAG: PD-(D/E)XK nuclease family protein, partial [Persicimonas sp.]